MWGVLTVRAFCRAEKSMINDHILSKNSFGKGHHCCSLFSPNKFYTISFLRLTPCLPPHSWSQSHRRLSSHHTPWTHAQSQSAGRENVCWPQPLHAAHHKYDFLWLGIQIFPFRALNNSILIISSFFKRKNHFLKFSYKVTIISKFFFPVFLLTCFATITSPS